MSVQCFCGSWFHEPWQHPEGTMKIYLVGPIEHEYDEYDSFVVVAHNPEEARQLATEETKPVEWRDGQDFSKANVEEITPDKARIVLGSFNAG